MGRSKKQDKRVKTVRVEKKRLPAEPGGILPLLKG